MRVLFSRESLRHVTMHLLSLGVLPLACSAVHGQEAEESFFRDLRLTIQARKMLLDDAQLAPLNLGVKVSNRVAVLWGPIPSQELSLRAQQRLRAMFELVEIRNNMTVEADDDNPLRQAQPDAPRSLPDPFPPAAPPPPRRPILEPASGVALAGIVTPDETLTVRSSPLGRFDSAKMDSTTVHIPFLGSLTLPR